LTLLYVVLLHSGKHLCNRVKDAAPSSLTNMTPFRFLHLPAEIRNSIYRLLLCQSTAIERSCRTPDLHPAVLRANHQVYDEAKLILYGENYFKMRIWHSYRVDRAHFVRCEHFAKTIKRELRQFRLIQRYDIHIDILDKEDTWKVKRIVRDVCNVLSEVPRIKHLIITLGQYSERHQALVTAFERLQSRVEDQNATPEVSRSSAFLAGPNDNIKMVLEDLNDSEILAYLPTESHKELEEFPVKGWFIEHIEFICQRAGALQPFTYLRNVGRVDVCGVAKPRDKEYLIDVMQGDSPLDHLPKMYDALDYYGRPFFCCARDLREARNAVDDGDVELFKRVREKVIKEVTACMAIGDVRTYMTIGEATARMVDAKERLFDYDARTDT
jgi:hypothetical protein